ncbi:hypothetical protein V493_05739 [Pseudogymnoascus sp. VKM F-4281 (FW-2241)]|nr:hypothetical protein V493_05739 [Pseudogymnoascus sp. VKM F-4281 (FW-2241)]
MPPGPVPEFRGDTGNDDPRSKHRDLQSRVACWPVTANYEAVVLSPWLDIRPSEQHRTGAFAQTACLNFSDYGRAIHRAEVVELGFLIGILESLAGPVVGRAVRDFIHMVEHREWCRWMVDTMDEERRGGGNN